MSRAVSFRLNDPGELMDAIRLLYKRARGSPGSRPLLYQDELGHLAVTWTRRSIDGRCDVSLGYATAGSGKKGEYIRLYGPFFCDCEDEVRDICQQLGLLCEIQKP